MVDGRTTDDGLTDDDGRRLDGYTISSPCEPNGSGELKKREENAHLAGYKSPSSHFTMQIQSNRFTVIRFSDKEIVSCI